MVTEAINVTYVREVAATPMGYSLWTTALSDRADEAKLSSDHD